MRSQYEYQKPVLLSAIDEQQEPSLQTFIYCQQLDWINGALHRKYSVLANRKEEHRLKNKPNKNKVVTIESPSVSSMHTRFGPCIFSFVSITSAFHK